MTPREKAIEWATAFARDPLAVVCDTETTGKDGEAEIVDIAVVRMDGTILVDTLIRPAHPIPVELTAIHGISNEMVADAPTWETAWEPVFDALAGQHVAAWNAPFDMQMVRQSWERYGLIPPFMAWDDPMQHYGAFQGTVGKYGGFKWWKLELACQHLGISPGGHRALADAEATRQVILAMAECCPLDVPDPPDVRDRRCPGCGGQWLMGKHFHPHEIADAMTALDHPEDWPSGAAEPVAQLDLFANAAPRRAARDWTR